jgi:hypothetical protein
MATAGSLSALKEISAQNRRQYGKSERTQKSYMTYVQKGKAWLTENTERLRKGLKDGEDSVDGVNVSLWESAFDYPPNKYSASALELFLTKRCFEDNLGQSTAELIQAAFADYWDNM